MDEKATNTTIKIYNFIPFKADGSFIVMCDAAFSEKEGKCSYGTAIYFDYSLVFDSSIFE